MLSDKNNDTSRSKSIRNRLERLTFEPEKEIIIEFKNVTKTYRLYKNDIGRFMGLFAQRKVQNISHSRPHEKNSLKKLSELKENKYYLGLIHANNRLSFEIKRGEAVAFFGRNGAGKSTALKIVAGITFPTSGKVIVKGRVATLLGLKAGFDGHLTGRENIRLRGQILGFGRKEIETLENRVIDFAELGVYIDQPIRTYSSGMKARLGFGFSTSIKPDILIIDEALSVGDKQFKKKCVARMREIMKDDRVTVLFVSHDTKTAKEFCSHGIVLDQGKKIFDGPIDEAREYYESIF